MAIHNLTQQQRRASAERLLSNPITATIGAFFLRSVDHQSVEKTSAPPVKRIRRSWSAQRRKSPRRARPRQHPRLDQKVVEHLAEYDRIIWDTDVRSALRAAKRCLNG